MKILLIKYLFILCASISFLTAQTAKIDSLKEVLPQLSGKAKLTATIELLNLLEDLYPAQAIERAKEGIEFAIQQQDTAAEIEMTTSMAYSYCALGDFPQSLHSGFHALSLAEKIGDRRLIASANSTLGISYVYVGQYSKALEHHLVALKLREELGLTERIIRTLNNIGIVYYNIGQYQKAVEYYKEALKRRMNSPNAVPTIRFIDNIGLAKTKLGHFDEAQKYHFLSLALADSLQYYGGLSYTYFNLGILHIEKKEYAKAIEYLQKSLTLYDSLKNRHGTTQVNNALGRAYYFMEKYTEAKQHLERAAASAQLSNSPEQLKTAYELLYSIFEKRKDNTAAYKYFKLLSDVKDTLYNRNEAYQIADLTIKLEILAKEREIAQLKNENQISELTIEKQNLKTRLIVVLIVMLVAIVFVLFYAYNKTEKSKSVIEQKNVELNSLNSALQEKINEIKTLSGLIPICANCKKVRDDQGFWEQVEGYISKHSEARFSHGICPDCIEKLYPDYVQEKNKKQN